MLCPIFITVCLLQTHVDLVFVARSSLTWQYAGEHGMSVGQITLTLRHPGTDYPDSASISLVSDRLPWLYVNQFCVGQNTLTLRQPGTDYPDYVNHGHITLTLRQPGTDCPDSTSTRDILPWLYVNQGQIALTLRQLGTDYPDSTSTRDIFPWLYVNQGHIALTLRQPGQITLTLRQPRTDYPQFLVRFTLCNLVFSWYYLVNSCMSFFPFSFGHGLLYSSLSFLLPVCIFRLVLQTSVT